MTDDKQLPMRDEADLAEGLRELPPTDPLYALVNCPAYLRRHYMRANTDDNTGIDPAAP